MDRKFQFSASSSSAAKVERRIVEKNRRNQMKSLCSQLNSLLPNQDSKEFALSLPDQIDEAIKYIKELEMRVNAGKEKKKKLLGKKASSTSEGSSSSAGGGSCPTTSPQLKIRENGRMLEIVLSSGLENQFLFCESIRILEQEGVEVMSANFSVAGNAVFHTLHAQLGDSAVEFGAAKVSERLKTLVYGSTSDMEMKKGQQSWDFELWDFEFPPETDKWDF